MRRSRNYPYISSFTYIWPLINITHQIGKFFTRDKPTLERHNHKKSIVYLRILSLCCAFCVFGEMYNDTYPTLWNHTKHFHCPENLVLLFTFYFQFSSFYLQFSIWEHRVDVNAWKWPIKSLFHFISILHIF